MGTTNNVTAVLATFKGLYAGGRKAVELFHEFVKEIGDALSEPVGLDELSRILSPSVDRMIDDAKEKGHNVVGGHFKFVYDPLRANEFVAKVLIYAQDEHAKWHEITSSKSMQISKLTSHSMDELRLKKEVSYSLDTKNANAESHEFVRRKPRVVDDHPLSDYPLSHKQLYLSGISLVIGSDRNIHEHEHVFLDRLLRTFEMPGGELERCLSVAKAFDVTIFESLFRFLREDGKARLAFLIDCLFAVNADGVVHKNEVAIVDTYFELLKCDFVTKKLFMDGLYAYNGRSNRVVVDKLVGAGICSEEDMGWIRAYEK